MFLTPKENLVRGLRGSPGIARSSADLPPVMVGHFSRFGVWYPIDSWYEGEFLERTMPGAFAKTIRENRETIKVQYDHGYDDYVGSSLLGPVDVLLEDDDGPYFEVPLLDTDYNRDRILPMLEGALIGGEKRDSLLGVSFQFSVMREVWVQPEEPSPYNPRALRERSIVEARLFEFGPVVWPASETADIGIRSLTDSYISRDRARRGASPIPPDAANAPRDVTATPPIQAPGLIAARAAIQMLELAGT